MPITGLDRMPGSGLARGTLFDKELNITTLSVATGTFATSIILEASGENKYTITWTQPSGDDRALTIPSMGADDQFTFNEATQTLTNKTLTSPTITGGALTALTDLDMTSGNKTILDTIGANSLTIGAGDTTVIIAGNLTVSGTTTTVNTTTLTIEDSLYVLNHGTSGTPSEDAGFVVERGDSTNVGFFWDESADEFVTVNTSETGSTAGNVTIASYANARVATLTAANISAFTLDGKLTAGSSEIEGSAFDIDGGNIDGTAIGAASASTIVGTTITANTSILPDASGGADIGSTSAEWGDIYVADDKKIMLGNAQDVSLEYDEDGTDTLLITGNVTFADGSYTVDIASHDTSNGLKLGGTLVTATAAELNLIDGSSANTVVNSKAVIYGSSGELAGTLSTASQGNVTSLGTLTALQVDNININGNTITSTDSNGDITITPEGTGEVNIASGNLNYAGTAITATGAELNLLDGGTARGTTAVASGDGIVINDAGTMRMTNVDTVSTYFSGHNVGGTNIVTTGALNAGSITSGFGTIDTGSSTITTTGLISGGSLDIDDVLINGSTIGHTDDTDLMTVADGVLTVAGELDATSLDISGNADIDGTLEADVITIDGTNVITGSLITTLGTISAGVWNGTAITGAYINDDIISGQSEITTGLAAADELLYSDGGTVKRVGLDNFIELAPTLATEDAVADGDYILFLDGGATGNMNKEAVHDLATLFAGTGLTASSSVIGVDASQTQITAVGTITSGTWGTGAVIGGATITLGSDATGDVYYRNASGVLTRLAAGSDADVLTLASGIPSWATPTVGDITGVTAGNGLSGGGTSGGVSLALDLSELSDTAIAHGDYIVFTDTTDSNASVKGDLADVATLFAGSGLTATNSVIAVDTLNQDTSGTAAIATTVTITDNESTDEDNAIIFTAGGDVDGGNLGLESDGTLTYNPSTGKITATGFIGALTGNVTGDVTGDVTGTADTATVATTVTITDNESTNEENAVVFTAGGDVDGGNLGLESDGDLTYNPSTGTVTATIFKGNIDAVDGDFDGTLEADALTVGGTNVLTGSLITTLGTISAGTWNGTAIASAYLDSDTAHLSGTQTFTGAKTFTDTVTVGVDDDGKDVKFFGETAGSYMLWDESEDDLILAGVPKLFIGDTANANQTIGLTINAAGNEGEIITLKASDFGGTDADGSGHDMTAKTESDTYGFIGKSSSTQGGLVLKGYSSAKRGMQLVGAATTDDTAKDVNANSHVVIRCETHDPSGDGDSTTTPGTDANLLTVRGPGGTVRFIWDIEGSAHADVEWTTYDKEDDLGLVKGMEQELLLREDEGQTERRKYLETVGIIGKNSWHMENGKQRAMINTTKLSMLHHGALIQVADKLDRLSEENKQLRQKLEALEV